MAMAVYWRHNLNIQLTGVWLRQSLFPSRKAGGREGAAFLNTVMKERKSYNSETRVGWMIAFKRFTRQNASMQRVVT